METKIKPSTGEHRISTRGEVFCSFQTGKCDFPGIYLLQDHTSRSKSSPESWVQMLPFLSKDIWNKPLLFLWTTMSSTLRQAARLAWLMPESTLGARKPRKQFFQAIRKLHWRHPYLQCTLHCLQMQHRLSVWRRRTTTKASKTCL